MPVNLVSSAKNPNISSTDTPSLAIDCTGADFLRVTIYIRDAGSYTVAATSVTYNGVAMTADTVGSRYDTGGGTQSAALVYTLKAPASGSHSVVANLNGIVYCALTAEAWSGVDQATSYSGATNGTTSAGPSTVTSGDVLVGSACSYNGGPLSSDGTAMQSGGGLASFYYQTSYKAAVGSQSLSWTGQGAAPNTAVVGVIRVAAAAPVLSGGVTLDDGTATGTIAPTPPSSASGNAVLGDVDASGTVGVAPGVLTSSKLWPNTGVGAPHTSAPFEAFVSNKVTGALVVRKTGLTSSASSTAPVCSFNDGLVLPGTQYRVTWRRTDTGAEGTELLTAT